MVTAKDVRRLCELVIQPAHEKILPDDTLRRPDKFSNVQVIAGGTVLEDLAVGVRIILEERNYSGAWHHRVGSVRAEAVDRTAGAEPRAFASRNSVRRRNTWQDSTLGCCGGNDRNRGFAARLTEALICAEEKSLVLLDRAAQDSPELIPMEWRQVRLAIIIVIFQIENGAGIERIVTEELEQRSVQCVGAAAGDR